MTARAFDATFWVHGVALVNTGGELCDACGERKAVGASVRGHLLCVRCAGWAAVQAEEYAREVEAARARLAAKAGNDLARVRAVHISNDAQPGDSRARLSARLKQKPARFKCGHSGTIDNVYVLPSTGYYICRTCQRDRLKRKNVTRRKVR